MKKLLFHVKNFFWKCWVEIIFVAILLSLVWYADFGGNPLFYVPAYLLFVMYITFSQDETDEELNSRLEKERKFIAMEKVYNSLNNILNNSGSNQLMLKTISDQYPKILKLVCGIDTEVKIINHDKFKDDFEYRIGELTYEEREKYHCRSIDL